MELHMEVKEIKIEKIQINKRQRKDLGDINGLQLSIETKGLIHPIVVEPDGKSFNLIAGERRLIAYKRLGKKVIPATLKSGLSEIDKQEIELEENIHRQNISFIEQAISIRNLNKLQREKYGALLPGRSIEGQTRGWGQKDTAKALGISEAKVSQDIQLADALDQYPQLEELENRRDALRELRRYEFGRVQRKTESVMIKRFKECFTYKKPSDGFKGIEDNTVQLVILDLREDIIESYIEETSRVLKTLGHAFIFFQLEQFVFLEECIKAVELHYVNKPLVWHIASKDDYVTFLWASREISVLPKHLKHHYSFRPDKEALHTQDKPYQLYYALINKLTKQGDFVFEPISFSLNIVKVCMDTGRNIQAFCPTLILYEKVIMQLDKARTGGQ